ncbi:MAG TPA: hypothetical protein VGK35_09630 [Actinotalea sp.]|jgi:hypothetical protein
MTGTAPADPRPTGRVGRESHEAPTTADLIDRAAHSAEEVAAGAPHALERLVAAVEELDDVLGADGPEGGGAPAAGFSRDELGDLLVTLSAAGVDAGERTRLALRLAAGLRATGAGPDDPEGVALMIEV